MRPSAHMLRLALAGFILTAVLATFMPDALRVALFVWGTLLALFLVDAFLGRLSGKLTLKADIPPQIYAGETEEITFSGPWEKPLPHDLRLVLEWPRGINGPDEIPVRVGGSAAQTGLALGRAAIRATKRGEVQIKRGWLNWSGPLGLVEYTPRQPIDAMIRVIPNIRPVHSGEIDVMVNASLHGMKENIVQGEGSEFHQLRDFQEGMDTRSIDWKRSARHRSLIAKETRAERNHQVMLALDNSYLMREEVAGMSKIDHQINAALAVAWAAVQGGDQVGMLAFDNKPRVYVPPRSGQAAFSRLRASTAALDYQSVEANHTLAGAYLQSKLKRRSLLIIFSDFADTTSAELFMENISILNRKHLVVFVTLKDPDLATRMATRPRSLNAVAELVTADEYAEERRLVIDRLRRIGVLCLEAAPKALTARLVSTYLNIKAREMI